MTILGINAFFENPSACLVRDGELLAFCQEERLIRLKGAFGHFPDHAVRWCLHSRNLTLGGVDRIAVSWGCEKYPMAMLRHLIAAQMKLRPSGKNGGGSSETVRTLARYLSDHTPRAFSDRIRDSLRSFGHRGTIPKIEFVDHHVAHAYQTFYQSPFADAAILIADGSGEEKCVSAFEMKQGTLRPVFSVDIPFSLGWYYAAFTAYLGFHPNRDEGKLMGLAAFGEQRATENRWLERIDEIIRVTSSGYELDPTFFKLGAHSHHPRFTDRLVEWIRRGDATMEPVGVGECVARNGSIIQKYLLDGYIDLAYAVQHRLEEALIALANRLHEETRSENLCLAGGVMMNCKANGAVLDRTSFKNLFVHPAASDDGSSIGAAFFVARARGDDPRNILRHAQLGPAYSNDEIATHLQRCGIAYQRSSDAAAETAKLLAEGKIVGWFSGAMEMGARALGGRSIIAARPDATMKNRINERVKYRESWRPYCPSYIEEANELYTRSSIVTPFMIVARKATPELLDTAPGVVHVDGTVRPQSINITAQPTWHRLLACVGKETGNPLVLNTSMNVRGEPIACTPLDAIRCFFSTGLDAMVLENAIVIKRP